VAKSGMDSPVVPFTAFSNHSFLSLDGRRATSAAATSTMSDVGMRGRGRRRLTMMSLRELIGRWRGVSVSRDGDGESGVVLTSRWWP
jgi:hypothetical protein